MVRLQETLIHQAEGSGTRQVGATGSACKKH